MISYIYFCEVFFFSFTMIIYEHIPIIRKIILHFLRDGKSEFFKKGPKVGLVP